MARINPLLVQYFSLICLIVFVACLFIGGEQPGAGQLFPPPWDKLVHVIAYATIGVMASLAFPHSRLAWILLIVVLVGASDEIHQIYIPGRQAGFDDWAADWVGGLIILPCLLPIRRLFYRQKEAL